MMPLARVQRMLAVSQGEDVGGLPGVVRQEGPVPGAFLDDPGQQAKVPLPELGDLLHHRLRELADHRLVLDRPEDLEVIRVLDVVPEVEAARPSQPLHRRQLRRQRIPELVFEDLPVVGEDRHVELGLAVEVAVEGPLGDARLLGHLVEIRAHEPVPEEDLLGRLEDASLGPRLLLQAPRGLAGHGVLGPFRAVRHRIAPETCSPPSTRITSPLIQAASSVHKR
jgi:hypothetical protein